jgi:hypothetical protein
MATTKQLIDKMKLNAAGWNRDGEKSLIEMLDEAQNILYEQEMYGTIAWKADGTLPTLDTTAGTQTYNINATTLGLATGTKLWRVGGVLVKQPYSTDLNSSWELDYHQLPNVALPSKSMYIGGIIYEFIHYANSIDNVDTSDPIVNLSIDPGATTDDYYILAYKKATPLTSEAVQPDIPTNLHFKALLPAAMKLVEAHQNGSWIETMEIMDRYMKIVRDHMNMGYQGEVHSAARREE